MESLSVAMDAWEQFYKNISGVGFSAFIILFGMGIAAQLAKFNPFLLTSKNLDLISGTASVSELFVPAMISVVITVAGLWSAIMLVDRKQL